MGMPDGLACSFALLSCILASQVSASSYTGLYVLGDSYSDQGNLLAATSAIGPGLGQPAQPDPSRYFDGRFSNGPNYVDVLASGLGVASTPSLLGGNNFAFGGAYTDGNTVEAPSFGTQAYLREAYPWSLNAEQQAFTAQANGEHANLWGDYAAVAITLSSLAGLKPG